MSSHIDYLYGFHIYHTTWDFLKFFVEHINIIAYDKTFKLIEEISAFEVTKAISYLGKEMQKCEDFCIIAKDQIDTEFNLQSIIRQLQVEYEETKRSNTDPNITNDKMVKELGSKIGEVSRQYKSLIKERQNQLFDRSYQISLKFYDDVGGKTYHLNYTHNLNDFKKEIFNFFSDRYVEPFIFADNFALFEMEGSWPGGAGIVKDTSQMKYYTICSKDLKPCDYKPLGELIKDWIHQDRLPGSTHIGKLSIVFR